MSQYAGSIPVDDVIRWNADATQRLLGFTIGMSPVPLKHGDRLALARTEMQFEQS